MPATTGKMQQWHPRMRVPDLVVFAPMEHRRHEVESAAAVRTPQDVEH